MITTDYAKTADLGELVERGVQVDGFRWAIIFADILAPALLDSKGALHDEAQALIAGHVRRVPPGEVARLRLVIADFHVLALILPDRRTCRFYTPGAAQEALLLKLSPDPQLQAHVDALGQHPAALTTIEELTVTYGLADLTSPTLSIAGHDRAALLQAVKAQVQPLAELINAYAPPPRERLQDWFLGKIARDDAILRQVLRFVAVMPSLRFDQSRRELVRALRENLRLLQTPPPHHHRQSLRSRLLALATRAIAYATHILPARVLGAVVERAVGLMAARFIVPDRSVEVTTRLEELGRLGRDASLDQLGELVLTQQEADHYAEAISRLIDLTAMHYGSSADRRVVNAAGIPRAQVSVKLSALSPHFNPMAPEATAVEMRERLLGLLRQAKRRGAFLCFDAEHYSYRDLSLHIPALVLAAAPDLDDFRDFGFVVQAYLRDAVPFVQQVEVLARQRDHRIQVRLVKGAYWDAETAEAAAQDVPAPTFWNKAETDIHFQQLVLYILERSETLALAVGSHNLREHAFAETVRSSLYPHAPMIEHQVLYRTAEGLARALAEAGWVTRDYMPVGDLLPGIAYLVRRILENSSQVGILAQTRDRLSADAIAADPARTLSDLVEQGRYVWDPAVRGVDEGFRPSPPVRLYLPAEREAFAKALTCTIVNNTPAFVTPADVPHMVQRAVRGAEAWRTWPPEARAALLVRAAELMRAQRLALGALIVREGRKVWAEALADVDEAVDYLRFYARSVVDWHSVLKDRLQPLGVAAIIAPWNFPLAIPCGMTAAALAAGNAVLLKPAEQTPAIGAALARLLHAAGVPSDALVFAPGDGQVGAALVANAQVDLVAFTGSWEVGAQIFYTSAQVPTRRLRRVIAETGSKNPIVVTASADLDTAIEGILRSAFGHAGQKCSACSRVLVDARLAQPLAERLGQAAVELRMGNAGDAATQLNPVITAADAARLRTVAARAAAEVQAVGGRVVVDATSEMAPTDIVGPAVFLLGEGIDPVQVPSANEELFGPILHIIPYITREEAVRLANAVPYALTAGIFAQSAEDVNFFAQRLDAGNLYINRPITAARVGVEPFGGFKRSGTGPKAGSEEYLLAFVEIAVDESATVPGVVERILRRNPDALAPRQTVHIPGQLNRLVYDRPLGRGLMLAEAPEPFRHAVVAAALAAGNHLTVVAASGEQTWALWETAARVAIHRPVEEWFNVVVGTDKEALAAVSAYDFVAGSTEALRRAAYAYAAQPGPAQLPAFISPDNGPPPDLPTAFVRRFVRPRLIAENTIRHGALISTGGM
jgi:RHH-type proline utilization regulon transcriptional repressor/proline dehydrogenase/delta 1-pyrroline-5-carboxylate dehydrogenase